MICKKCKIADAGKTGFCRMCERAIVAGARSKIEPSDISDETGYAENEADFGAKYSWRYIFFVLRVLRAICGFVFVIQLIHILEALLMIPRLQSSGGTLSALTAVVSLKIVIAVVSGSCFMGFRRVINTLHIKINGVPHPKLSGAKWSL